MLSWGYFIAVPKQFVIKYVWLRKPAPSHEQRQISNHILPGGPVATEQLPLRWMGMLTSAIGFSRYYRAAKRCESKCIICFKPYSLLNKNVETEIFILMEITTVLWRMCWEGTVFLFIEAKGKWWLSLTDLMMVRLSICVIVWEGLTEFLMKWFQSLDAD